MTDQKFSDNMSKTQTGVLTINPNYTLSFHNENKRVGTLDFTGDKMTFTGDFKESAEKFMTFIASCFKARLDAEYQRGRCDAAKEKPLTFVRERAMLEQEYCELAALKRTYMKEGKHV